jgi:hypothetical protein
MATVVVVVLGGTLLGMRLASGSGLRLGLAGPYSESALSAARAAGVTELLVEVEWRRAEPVPGQFDNEYLDSVSREIADLRSRGFRTALNMGIHDAPDWLLERPGARYVDQSGSVYTDRPVPDLVFATQYRPLAESYAVRLLRRLGTDFSLIRVGGGPLGELSFPYKVDRNAADRFSYWGFGPAAATNPVPGWRPGMPSPNGEAATFLTWYLDSLVDYQNWQVAVLRTAGYRGDVAVLYPSYGLRPGDAERGVAADLDGTTSAEVYDFARQIRGLDDPRTVVYGTWGENARVVDYLAGLASATGHAVMAENSGAEPQAQIDAALRHAARTGLAAFYLIRAPDFACHCESLATFEGVARTYSSLGRPSRRAGRRSRSGHHS